MNPKGIRDHLSIFLLLLLILFLSPPNQYLWGWADNLGPNRGIAVLVVAYSLIMALTLFFARLDKVNITFVTRKNGVRLACVLFVMSLILALAFLISEKQKVYGIEDILSISVPSLLFVGLGEELAYRGYVQSLFLRKGSKYPILIAAILFALYHSPVDLLTNGFSVYVIALLVPRVVAGMVFGWAYHLTGEVAISASLHGFYDMAFALSSGVTFATITLQRFLPPLVSIAGFLVVLIVYKVPMRRLRRPRLPCPIEATKTSQSFLQTSLCL